MSSRRSAAAIGWAGAGLIRCLALTWRIRITGEVHAAPIFALLHGHLLLPAFAMRKTRAVVMVSQHRDGERIAQAVQRLGFSTVRGSSTRGGAAAARDMMGSAIGLPWVVTPDGPKGPRGSVKAGLIRLAAATGRVIQPVAGAARPAKVFGSWDRFTVPLPFARVVVHFGPPLGVPGGVAAERIRALVLDLQERLAAAENAAAAALANW